MHMQEIPSWADTAKKALLVQPSSAASEWVFALHACSRQVLMNSMQGLKDYIETSLSDH